MIARLRRALRTVADPLRDELAVSWPVALLVLVLASLGLAAAAPLHSLRSEAAPAGTALGLVPIPAIGPVAGWTAEVAGPHASRIAALGTLFPVLYAVAWAVLALALLAVLARLVAQSYERGPEIGIRRAVGASRLHILGAQGAEAALVGLGVAAVALPVAWLAWRGAAAAWPGPVTGARFLPLGAAAAVAGVLGIGALLPLAHRSARRLTGGDPMPVTLALPAAQIGASLAVLLAGAIMLRHAATITPPGRAPDGAGAVLELAADAPAPERRAAAYGLLLDRLAATSAWEVASLASRGAHRGLGTVDFAITDCGQCARGMIILRWLDLYATHHAITPDTFAAAGLRLVAGRGIERADDWAAPRVAVVNRHLAARYFQQGDAVGRDIYIGTGWPQVRHRVVGIVDDARPPVLGGSAQPRETVYLSALQHPPAAVELVLRARGGAPGAEGPLPAALGGIARVERTLTEAEQAASEARPLAWFGWGFGIAGAAALLVALFATVDTAGLWVRSISGELAMRRAAGATGRRIARYVGARVAGAVAAGVIAGVLIFATLIREYLVLAVPGIDVWHLPSVAAAAVLLLAAALTGAARATRAFLRRAPAHWLG